MIDWNGLLAATEPVTLSGTALRLMESQEHVATNHLVSSLERQSVLEEMLEKTKPPLRKGTEALHYLLATPFRYPPLKHGSRFGRRGQPSLFYGSLETRTVLAESAYYRFLFWYGMATPPSTKLDTLHTLFGAPYRSDKGIQLQAPPFAAHRAALTDPADYTATQTIGTALREAGIDLFEFVSARDPEGGINVALFTPAPFSQPLPAFQEAWLCELTAAHVRFREARGSVVHNFPLSLFLADGALPWPT